MASIGIIANPASGKDIRRLVSYATVIDNNEKVNIVKRIVLAAQGLGVDDIHFMPDSFMMGYKVIDELTAEGVLRAKGHVLDMKLSASAADSTEAARLMEALGVGCIVVLGGDGTSRAAAKGLAGTPIIPVSTGTNNVYPTMLEGTIVGMAAASIARFGDPLTTCVRDKRIELWRGGVLEDIALIDAVVSNDIFVGARAIWDAQRIRRIVVTRCHPASIGFSAVAGTRRIVRPEDDFGCMVVLGEGAEAIVPLAAGVLERLRCAEPVEYALDTDYPLPVEQACMIALDGERELRARPEDEITVRITRGGPWRVDVRATLERALRDGLFARP